MFLFLDDRPASGADVGVPALQSDFIAAIRADDVFDMSAVAAGNSIQAVVAQGLADFLNVFHFFSSFPFFMAPALYRCGPNSFTGLLYITHLQSFKRPPRGFIFFKICRSRERAYSSMA
jgi:hypothetical protein